MVSKATAFKTADAEPSVRLTVAQATIRFLAHQYVERDGERTKFFAGCFGIFGHGNVAGVGQALLQAEIDNNEPKLRYVLGRNEQAMVHSAAAYARQKDRLQAWVVTASIGPGSTNMLTGAALATINRLPVLLLPSDTFATRVSAPVLQDLEQPHDNELTVNDAFKPLSRFFDRVWRPEQLPSALLGAMRVLTDPVETGAATIALPQDVQAEAFDWPESLFAERTWHIARPVPERSVIARAAEVIESARRPLIVAGGGVIYSGANDTRHPWPQLAEHRRMVYVACHSYHMGGNIDEIIHAAGNGLQLVHITNTMDHHHSHGLRYITNPPGNPARVHQHLKIGDGDVGIGTSSSADSPRSTSTTGPTP